MVMLLLTAYHLITVKQSLVSCFRLMQMSNPLIAQAVSPLVLTLRNVAGVTGLRIQASTVRKTLSGTEPLVQIKME